MVVVGQVRVIAAQSIHVEITDRRSHVMGDDTITLLCTLASCLSLCKPLCLTEHIFFSTIDFYLSLFVQILIITIVKVFDKFYLLLFVFRFGWEWLQIPRLQKCGPPEKKGICNYFHKNKKYK
jgi:hypothetical protein